VNIHFGGFRALVEIVFFQLIPEIQGREITFEIVRIGDREESVLGIGVGIPGSYSELENSAGSKRFIPAILDNVLDRALVGILRINNDILMFGKQVTEVGSAHHGQLAAVGVFTPLCRIHLRVSAPFLEVVYARKEQGGPAPLRVVVARFRVAGERIFGPYFYLREAGH